MYEFTLQDIDDQAEDLSTQVIGAINPDCSPAQARAVVCYQINSFRRAADILDRMLKLKKGQLH